MDFEGSKKHLSRRQFVYGTFAASTLAVLGLTGCNSEGKGGAATEGGNETKDNSSSSSNDASASKNDSAAQDLEKLVMVWYPNESASEYDDGRAEFGAALEKAFGVPVELMTTTDYNVAIEAVTSGKAHMAYLGAEGYTTAEERNPSVKCIMTTSDSNGTLDEAMYYSRIAVREADADQYNEGGEWKIDNIKGKSMSFVSPSSTSGFKVPSSYIVEYFDLEGPEVLQRGGEFFSEVLYGNSHQGSIVNLLAENCDVCAVDDIDIVAYLEPDVLEGEPNQPGAVYKVKEGADAPFDRVIGKTFTIIQSSAVLNAPFVVNYDVVSEEAVDKALEYLTSDEVAQNEMIFSPEGKNAGALWEQEGNSRFVSVEPEWYDPIRNM